MILFQNQLIVLDYDPSSDILSVVWPNVNPYDMLEIERSLQLLVEYIRDYDVKKLLIDSSKTEMHPEVDPEKYISMVTEFAKKLQKTRLQRSARIIHQDQVRETESNQVSEKVTQNVGLQIESRSFINREEAREWLCL
ncbi:hypothetical protein [Rufibacter roseus]|uniref:STAS/SEC14 domain-containing protein n=1 Tax=Rufibacter roseus TaxID=1567108 RepID=A0ABW2DS92_9BACT|nr:hypothetical protein [Rufibacter roseus]